MTYNPSIPNGPDRFPASQPQIKNNFGFANTYFDVDHFAFNAAMHNGEHRKITLNSLSPSPGAIVGADVQFCSDATEGSPPAASLSPYYTSDLGNVYGMHGCAAWAYWNGASMTDSFNIASIAFVPNTFTVVFSQNFINSNYAMLITPEITGAGSNATGIAFPARAVGSVSFSIRNQSGGAGNFPFSIVLFGRLAP